jgi:DNA-binding XRE family transcriptional regulator
MQEIELASYLRFHRKRSGLTQRDLGNLIGHLTKHQVSKHERAEALPSLLSALAYEAVFRVPVAALYPGIYRTLQEAIDGRLQELEARLQQSSVKGRAVHATAKTLVWLTERSPADTA